MEPGLMDSNVPQPPSTSKGNVPRFIVAMKMAEH